MHLNFIWIGPPAGAEDPNASLSDQEIEWVERRQAWLSEEWGYGQIQGTKPQTLGYGLNDSPAGLAAWLVEKFRSWSASDGNVESNTSGAGGVLNEITYEKRFGPRSMWEVIVPFGARELSGKAGWGNIGVGDIAVAVKHTVHHSVESGSIAAVGGEVILPTGSTEQGLGTGVARFEPFVAYGQILPNNLFLQLFGAVELSTDREKVSHEALWRAVVGGSWSQADFGRTWSPMVEVLGDVALTDGARVDWSLVPQLQMSLNQRQHILLNVGVRLQLTNSHTRSTQLLMYVLWDWFDGGFFDGW